MVLDPEPRSAGVLGPKLLNIYEVHGNDAPVLTRILQELSSGNICCRNKDKTLKLQHEREASANSGAAGCYQGFCCC